MPSKMSVRNRAIDGRAKFAWFKTLKNSARNCTLKLSEILLIELFLNTEKSRFDQPRPRQDVATGIAAKIETLRAMGV